MDLLNSTRMGVTSFPQYKHKTILRHHNKVNAFIILAFKMQQDTNTCFVET